MTDHSTEVDCILSSFRGNSHRRTLRPVLIGQRLFQRRNAVANAEFLVLDPRRIRQRLIEIGPAWRGNIDDRFLFAGNLERRHARQVAHFQIRIKGFERINRSSMVPARLHQDVHVLCAARPTGPAADAMSASQHEGSSLLG